MNYLILNVTVTFEPPCVCYSVEQFRAQQACNNKVSLINIFVFRCLIEKICLGFSGRAFNEYPVYLFKRRRKVKIFCSKSLFRLWPCKHAFKHFNVCLILSSILHNRN